MIALAACRRNRDLISPHSEKAGSRFQADGPHQIEAKETRLIEGHFVSRRRDLHGRTLGSVRRSEENFDMVCNRKRPGDVLGNKVAVDESGLKELMLASLDGHAAAYRTLLDHLSRHLRAYYKRRLAAGQRHTEDAEDLVQETLIAIHTRRHTYDRTKPLTPWVFAIARYRLIDYLRHTRGFAGDVPLDEADHLLADRDESWGESAYDLDILLRRLPEGTRRAIECMKLEGMSAAEAASRCGISESAVKVKVHRGLKKLAALIMREKAKA